MSLEVLLSTMHLDDGRRLVASAALTGAAVVVNQNDRLEGHETLSEEPRRVVVHSTERGLSRSRNLALDNATADICLLADDDEVFAASYEDRVLSTFDAHPHRDVIAFSVQYRDGLRKRPLHTRRVGRLALMKLSSVQLAFRREAVIRSGVRFDVDFGAGSRHVMGEELIFLSDLRRAGLRVASVPLEIAHLERRCSSWFTGYDEAFFRSRGASFSRADPRRARAYAFQWALRKRALFRGSVGVGEALRLMDEGRREWRRGPST